MRIQLHKSRTTMPIISIAIWPLSKHISSNFCYAAKREIGQGEMIGEEGGYNGARYYYKHCHY